MDDKKKDFWDKLQASSTFLIPLIIAVVGWHFTERYNQNQLDLQNRSAEKQNEIENIKLQVAQAQLTKDLMQQLTSTDRTTSDIALATLVYSAPALGKNIADLVAKKGGSSQLVVANIYDGKRADLITRLFSTSATTRLSAYNEITTSWLNDEQLLAALIAQARSALSSNDMLIDKNNGVYNSLVVFKNYPPKMLIKWKPQLDSLVDAIPSGNGKTRALANELMSKIKV
ncbi:hypothetical protein [Mucilaginibacter ginsenosidivorans]|uniref:Uncharacterized protein n=1 Tax=Mucilaginibacter ginsenosidivorans TaxID=398053 RepID=A0A5B8V0Q0_9SPHI|nr:hypothetical protein [Mucilaginibacter ginsenosidivorans]QEC64383.1 hypothetical protein FRZ54_17970 [Mucilaginibacter ginsenosidivorans]